MNSIEFRVYAHNTEDVRGNCREEGGQAPSKCTKKLAINILEYCKYVPIRMCGMSKINRTWVVRFSDSGKIFYNYHLTENFLRITVG